MFRQHPKEIQELLRRYLRQNGLETPWLQHRLIESWSEVAGAVVAQYTEQVDIRNQTLWVKLTSPALRNDLHMQRSALVKKLNDTVGAQIITDIRYY